MTSQLNVDTIVDKAGSGGSNVKMANTSTYVSDGGAVTQNTVQGLAKVWLFASSGNSISDSLNMTSITDNGASDNTYNIANDFANSTFSVGSIFGQSGHDGFVSANMFAVTTGSIRTSVYLDSNSHYEASLQCYTIHGDLA
jgi:hypothetical protein